MRECVIRRAGGRKAILVCGGLRSCTAGGGGGSGFGPAGVAFQTGVQAGNGAVSITYDPAVETCEPDVIDDDVDNDVIEATPPFTG